MSKPRFRWWQYAIKMAKDFPALDAASYLSVDDQRDRDAVARAIEATKQQPQGEHRLTFINSVYWDKHKQTINEAAAQLPITDTVANRWHSDFIREIGKSWGFDISKPAKKARPPTQKDK